MKKKFFALIFGAIFSFQIMFSGGIVVNANDIIAERTVYLEKIPPLDEPIEVELYEGEVVQLELSDNFEFDDKQHIRFSSLDFNAAVTQDLKLVGCNEGEGVIDIHFGNEWPRLKVNVKSNENISAENRAELDRINDLGNNGDDYIRRKMELRGVIDEDAPRLDMNKVEEIINTSDSFDEILKRFDLYHGFMDLFPYGSSSTRGYYWFDEKGNEQIYYIVESELIYYTKIAEDGTAIGKQMLYPEKSEFHEYDHSDYKDYNYIQYNQIPPEGYGTVSLNILDSDTNEPIGEALEDFQLIATPIDDSSTEEPKIIGTWNPSDSNPHTISELSREYQYEIQYLGAKEGEYWYEIDESSQTSFNFTSKDEYSFNIYMKKHYFGEPVLIPEGDVNDDGVFNITDVVTFQKWLYGSSDTKLNVWLVADFCEDGVLNVFDLALMKKELVE